MPLIVTVLDPKFIVLVVAESWSNTDTVKAKLAVENVPRQKYKLPAVMYADPKVYVPVPAKYALAMLTLLVVIVWVLEPV